MDNEIFTRYAVEDRSYTAFIKREIHNTIAKHGFSESRIAEVDIIISELTSNLVKHAKGGELLFRVSMENNGRPALEIVCIDEGAGIPNLKLMVKDGVSTVKTLGHGLGAIQRLSDFCQIYSLVNWGTIIYSKILSFKEPTQVRKNIIELKPFFVPKSGQDVSGDGYYVKNLNNETHIFFGDALGHGKEAWKVISIAIESFKNCKENEPIEMLRCIHNDTRRTRGLVGTVAILNHTTRQWRICGIGNILTKLYSGSSEKNFRPYNGVIGMNIPTSLNSHVFEAENNQYLIMCSDGIKTRWDFSKFSAMYRYDLMVLAATLYKDLTRRSDDASIMLGRIKL
jgi:anti-sigma regulatory factor (Ser/Thr protein kinase)